jgi:hypothetical protein
MVSVVSSKILEPTLGAWTWSGNWAEGTVESWGRNIKNKATTGAGAEASLTFSGTGVAIVGHCAQDGGRADVYLDGKKEGEIDAWIPERTHDNDLWHVTGLPAGKHTVRIVSRADKDSRSKGTKIRIDWAVIYGSAAP